MIVTHKIKMDLANRGITPVVDVMQDDQYSRNLELSLYAGHEAFALPEDCAVLVRYKKSDGRGGLYDTMPDGTKAWSIDENTITVALPPQVCTVPGTVEMNIAILSEGRQLNSFEICLKVGASPQGNLESARYISLSNCLPQILDAAVGRFLKVSSVDGTGKVIGLTAEDVDTSVSGAGLVVRIVANEDNFTADHTVQQIKEAYDAGQMVFCYREDGRIIPLAMCLDGVCLFTGLGLLEDESMGALIVMCIEEDGQTVCYGAEVALAARGEIPTVLPNPYSLRFTGQISAEYRGDTFVSVYIPKCVPEPLSAVVGQVMSVATVNSTGVPTSWKAVDPQVVTSSGGSKYKIIVDDSGNLSTEAVS